MMTTGRIGVFFISLIVLTIHVPAGTNLDVKVDQIGYLPTETKLAMITSSAARGVFTVKRMMDDSVAFTGSLDPALYDPDSGDTIRIADFSTLREHGTFYLDVVGVGTSYPFDIAPDVFANAFYMALRSFYGQRCGVAVDLSPTFPDYRHAACHTSDALFHPSSGRSGSRDGTQGWHDAGDYGKYVVNSGITTGELLWTYEWYASQVADVRLDIPESENGIPDILAEIRWNLDWMLKMQDEDGGVWHKLTSTRFGSFVPPEMDDAGPHQFIGTGRTPYKSSCATADLAAVMAIAARVYEPFDPEFAKTCQMAAQSAWTWVSDHPNVTFRNPPGVSTGEYGDDNCSDELLWAAAELFHTTGNAEYNDYFRRQYTAFTPTVRSTWPQSWNDVRHLAMWTYYFSDHPDADPTARDRIRTDTLNAANAIVMRSNRNGYRHSLQSSNYVWGSNGVAADYGVLLLVANGIRPHPNYINTALNNLHYLLGRNTFNLSFVTQLGSRSVQNPHHRPSRRGVAPWPGLLVGGPNRYGGDPIIDRLPATPPARRYADDQGSYASNENAINWNAALVFLLASTLPTPAKSNRLP